jgi:hypothetical protein
MNVHVYANCWNELRMLPFFIRHYHSFVARFFILDDGSTDGSLDFLKRQAKVSLVKANRERSSYIEQSHIFFNQAWKRSRFEADWIITCNVDEHVYHKNMEAYLQSCLRNGVTVIPALGYEMVALGFPSVQGKLCDVVRLGAQAQWLTGPSNRLDKIMVFNPQAIEDIHFDIGRHKAHPTGRVVYADPVELKLLHYKFLGLAYAKQRYAELKTGLSSVDREKGLGFQYTWDTRIIQRNYEAIAALAHVAVPVGWFADALLRLSILPLKIKLRIHALLSQQQHQIASPVRHLVKTIKKMLLFILPNR